MAVVHTYPIKDLIEHDLLWIDCVCGPDVEAVVTVSGEAGFHVVHHSLDGRELRENA